MIEALLSQAAEVVGGRLSGKDGGFRGVFSDTREPMAGGLFVALKGERFDGHDFVEDAKLGGAAGMLVREGTEFPEGLGAIVVGDTLQALGRLACWYRKSLQGKVIAITGSMGKSTTRRLIASMLPGPVHEAPASYNNLIGVPLTLLSAPKDAGYVVCEAGINRPGEMEQLAEIIQPDVSVLTNIAPVHLEALGSLAEIAREKAVLLRSTRNSGLIVHGCEEGLSRSRLDGATAARVGPDDFQAQVDLVDMDANASARFRIGGPGGEFETALPLSPYAGRQLLPVALETALRLGVGLREAVMRLEERFEPLPGRWSVHRMGKHLVLNDAMNANPEATKRALEALRLVPVEPKAALLGDMLELGPESAQFHEQVGAAAASSGLDLLLATGEMADIYVRGYEEAGGRRAERVDAPVEMGLRALLARFLPQGGLMLVKASHALRLDRLFEDLP